MSKKGVDNAEQLRYIEMHLTNEHIEELNTAFDTMAKTEYKDPKTGATEIVCTKEDLR